MGYLLPKIDSFLYLQEEEKKKREKGRFVWFSLVWFGFMAYQPF